MDSTIEKENPIRVRKQDILNYLAKGPEHMHACTKEMIGHIKQLTRMMTVLLADDPVTAMLVGLRIETKVYDKYGSMLFEAVTGGQMAEEGARDERISDTDAD